MKKVVWGLLVILLTIITFYLSYNYKHNQNPTTYYKVYLNDEVIGVINSEDKLNRFIDAESDSIKAKYNVDTVYAPEGLRVEQLESYNEQVSSVEDVFDQIVSKASLTIEGYQITIKNDDNSTVLYVTDEDVFKNAATDLIKTFVGSDKYDSYINNNQTAINGTGSIVSNIYIQNDITIKKTKISVDNTIYTDEKTLSHFLLYGDNATSKTYTVQLGDTISKVASDNEISTEEFLISNPQFTDKNNLLHVGQEVNIAVTNPQLKVVLEEHEIVDLTSNYITEERYDASKYIGDDEVIQEGQNGTVRVTQDVQTVNGAIAYIDPIAKQEIKPSVNKIVIKGNKYVASVGDTKNWAWPTNSGYTLTDLFEWRINPITGLREHHSGIDISGTGYGSPIYASNNGVVITKTFTADYGYHIVINHNNGYWTVYAHMSKYAANISVGSVVARGQIIGYVGSSGWATGPHLHFEVWKDCEHCRINPLSLFD